MTVLIFKAGWIEGESEPELQTTFPGCRQIKNLCSTFDWRVIGHFIIASITMFVRWSLVSVGRPRINWECCLQSLSTLALISTQCSTLLLAAFHPHTTGLPCNNSNNNNNNNKSNKKKQHDNHNNSYKNNNNNKTTTTHWSLSTLALISTERQSFCWLHGYFLTRQQHFDQIMRFRVLCPMFDSHLLIVGNFFDQMEFWSWHMRRWAWRTADTSNKGWSGRFRIGGYMQYEEKYIRGEEIWGERRCKDQNNVWF